MLTKDEVRGITEYKQIKDHVLTKVSDKPIEVYYLHKPGVDGKMETRMGSTLVMFTPEGIILAGDLTPQTNGSVSVLGKGKGFFTANLDPDYLAVKFLRDDHYEPERARAELRQWIQEWLVQYRRDYGNDGVPDWLIKVRDMWHATVAIDRGDYKRWMQLSCDDIPFDTYGQLYEAMSPHIRDFWEIHPGMGYSTSEYRWLAAIQARFADAYREQYPNED